MDRRKRIRAEYEKAAMDDTPPKWDAIAWHVNALTMSEDPFCAIKEALIDAWTDGYDKAWEERHT